MATLTGSDILARSLVSQGMDTLFYIMGGPMIETEAAVIKLGARAVDTRHEQAASLMAHAYSRVTRKPGVCMGASGPGATNLVTGVANAFVDAAPMIAVGGSSPRVFYEMEAFQEIDQLAVFKPITKWAARIYDTKCFGRPDTARFVIDAARAFDAEAVFCVSNPTGTRTAVHVPGRGDSDLRRNVGLLECFGSVSPMERRPPSTFRDLTMGPRDRPQSARYGQRTLESGRRRYGGRAPGAMRAGPAAR